MSASCSFNFVGQSLSILKHSLSPLITVFFFSHKTQRHTFNTLKLHSYQMVYTMDFVKDFTHVQLKNQKFPYFLNVN